MTRGILALKEHHESEVGYVLIAFRDEALSSQTERGWSTQLEWASP
jgi:hypothetical protein